MIDYKLITTGLNIRPEKGAFGYSTIALIDNGIDKIIFDTGGYGVRKEIMKALKEEKITKLFISHLHFDHCSNADLFKGIDVYINKKEIDYLFSVEVKNDIDYFLPFKEYINNLNIITFDDEFEISSGIFVKHTYGHTIGHSSLTFNKDGKKHILCGDSIKTLIDYKECQCMQNAFCKETSKLTKAEIVKNYDILIPGHSGVIEYGDINEKILPLKYF